MFATAHDALLVEGENRANTELVDSTNVVFVYSMSLGVIRAHNGVGFSEKGVSGGGGITGGGGLRVGGEGDRVYGSSRAGTAIIAGGVPGGFCWSVRRWGTRATQDMVCGRFQRMGARLGKEHGTVWLEENHFDGFHKLCASILEAGSGGLTFISGDFVDKGRELEVA